MLGTFPKGVKPSPRPVYIPKVEDPFEGGYKFAYLAVEQNISELDNNQTASLGIFEKIKRLISQRESACLLVGRVIPGWKSTDIGKIEYPKCDPRAIVDLIATVANQYELTECYTDQKAYEWLTNNNFYNNYSALRHTEIREEILENQEARLKDPRIQEYVIEQNYEVSLLKIKRPTDSSIRVSEFSAGLENGRIGLTPDLRQDQKLLDSIKKVENLILCDAIGGLLIASDKYR